MNRDKRGANRDAFYHQTLNLYAENIMQEDTEMEGIINEGRNINNIRYA